MSCLCLCLFLSFWAEIHLIFRLGKSCFGDIVSKLAWNFVISRARVLIVLGNGFASSDGKLSGEAVFHSRNNVLSSGRKIHMRSIIWSRSGHFAGLNMGSAANFAEVSNAATFVLRQKIVAFFVDAKCYGIGSWSRNTDFLLILFMWLLSKRVGRFRQGRFELIWPRTWVFV